MKCAFYDSVPGARHDHWGRRGNEHSPEDRQDDDQEQGPSQPGLAEVGLPLVPSSLAKVYFKSCSLRLY